MTDNLHPQTGFSVCGQNQVLLNKRCRVIMEEIAHGRVKHHEKWKDIIRCNGAAAEEIAVYADCDENSWQLILEINPGDTIAQARKLYPNVDDGKLLGLTQSGWTVRPNFHLAHIQKDRLWTHTSMSTEQYVSFWKGNASSIRQIKIVAAGVFPAIVDKWAELGLLVEEDKKKIEDNFTKSNRKKVNVCPGLSIQYRWDAAEAVRLDSRKKLTEKIKEKIQEALSTWKQLL